MNDKNIEMQFIHLVDAVKKFNELAYDAYVFVLALQVWAYDVIPDLGRYCVTILEGNELLFPRILRWSAEGFYRYDDLICVFPMEPAEHRGLVGPSEEEWKHLQMLSLQQRPMSPPKLFEKTVGKALKCKDDENYPTQSSWQRKKLEEDEVVGNPSLWKGSASRVPKFEKSAAHKLCTPNPSMYDLLDASYMARDVKPFQNWYGKARGLVSQHFENMSRFVPLLCRIVGIWSQKHKTENLKPVWDMERLRHPP
ncbi:hypothetical protein C2S52_020598 [Perilla frutescens var. hirtella]|nr:hypothetical protein C2S52_020598 [Perilla frutescens var. hirtella]